MTRPHPLQSLVAAVIALSSAWSPAAVAFSGAVGSEVDTIEVQRELDTGKTVDLQSGDFYPSRALILKTPGQLVRGAGRNATRIHVRPGFSGDGVFSATTTMATGPVLRDFQVLFYQPDTGDYAHLIRYPPAFNLKTVPRFEMAHIGCFEAIECVDMRGSSGATIEDLQFSAFDRGIEIDGSLDTTRIIDPHWFPFEIKPKQQLLFSSQGNHRPIGISIGRADDVVLRGGLFLGGLGIRAFTSELGSPFGTIDSTDFDSLSGFEMSGGSFRLGTCIFNVAASDATGLLVTGGMLSITSSSFYSGKSLNRPLLVMRGRPGFPTTTVTISAPVFDTAATDTQAIEQDGGVLTMTGAQFSKAPGKNYDKPVISLNGGRTLMAMPYVTDKGAGHGIFIDVRNDSPANRIIGAVALGWSNRLPTNPLGQYVLK